MYGAKVRAVCKIAGREPQKTTMDFTQGDLRKISRLHLTERGMQILYSWDTDEEPDRLVLTVGWQKIYGWVVFVGETGDPDGMADLTDEQVQEAMRILRDGKV